MSPRQPRPPAPPPKWQIEPHLVTESRHGLRVEHLDGLVRIVDLGTITMLPTGGPTKINLTRDEAVVVSCLLADPNTAVVQAPQAPQAPVRSTIAIPITRWLTSNDRHVHWSIPNQMTQEFRRAARYLALKEKGPRFSYCSVDAFAFGPSALRHDPGNLYPTIKACIDGLVDAKVLPNDTRRQIPKLTMHAPQPNDRERLVLVLTAIEPPKGPLL